MTDSIERFVKAVERQAEASERQAKATERQAEAAERQAKAAEAMASLPASPAAKDTPKAEDKPEPKAKAKAKAKAKPKSKATVEYAELKANIGKMAAQGPAAVEKIRALLKELGVAKATELDEGQWDEVNDRIVAMTQALDDDDDDDDGFA